MELRGRAGQPAALQRVQLATDPDGQIETAESTLECAEQGVSGDQETDRVLLGQIAVARVHIARGRGDGQQVIELAARALELLPPENLSERSITAMNLGMAQWHTGRIGDRHSRQVPGT